MNTKSFFSQSDNKRLAFYNKHYLKESKSWKEIASILDTYSNKVRRDAAKLGIKSRDKSQAQKVAISSGRSEHPTQGKKRSEETKIKISESQGKIWDDLSDEEREYRSQIGRESWDKKTDREKDEFFKKSVDAIQKASREGSKMEGELFEFLTRQGYKVWRHREQVLKNEKFHIDLYIPSCRTAIEVDGPVHFEPVYGQEKLMKRQAADLSKNGLILSSGMALIRVKLNKRMSQRYLRTVKEQILDILHQLETKFPSKNARYFEI